MSRLPRAQEYLKTGFTAEAASAARLRALGARAEREGRPNLASSLRELAGETDALAIVQSEAAEAIRRPAEELDAQVVAVLAEERYENDALYPKMARDADEATASLFREVIARQTEHAQRLESLLDALSRATADIPA